MQAWVLEESGASPGGWWARPGPYPTLQTDPARPQGTRFQGSGFPEHQPWFCCCLGKSRSLVPRQQEGNRTPARQPKWEGTALGHTARQGQRDQSPRLLSRVQVSVPWRPKLQTESADGERKQAARSLVPGLRPPAAGRARAGCRVDPFRSSRGGRQGPWLLQVGFSCYS